MHRTSCMLQLRPKAANQIKTFLNKHNNSNTSNDNNQNNEKPVNNDVPSSYELKKLGNLQYYLYTPSNPTEGMPLIMYLNGGQIRNLM